METDLRKKLIEEIGYYDTRSSESVSLIVRGVLDVEDPAPPGTKERLTSSVAAREALRNFGVKVGLLERDELVALL